MDKSRVKPTIFFIEKISFSLKLFSGNFYGQSFIKTVRGPLFSSFIVQYKIEIDQLQCVICCVLDNYDRITSSALEKQNRNGKKQKQSNFSN